MERREVKVQRKLQSQSISKSKSTSSFPVDVTTEILLRLPAKSVVRFRSVSKLWSSITTDPYFIKSFETHSSKRPSLLLFFQKRVKEKLSVFSIPQHHHDQVDDDSSEDIVDRYEMTNPKNCRFSFSDSVHGLICFQGLGGPMIWNPTMRKFLTLPKLPEENWIGKKFFLGYDPIEGKHKVVCLPSCTTCIECRVLTLGSSAQDQESWRKIKTNHTHYYPSFDVQFGIALCIIGVVYYQARNESSVRVIMRFDVRAEKFDMIELPPNNNVCLWKNNLFSYEGKLAFATYGNTITNVNGITIWILEDAKKHEWSSKQVLAPLTHYDLKLEFYQELKCIFALSGITPAGELIYVPSSFYETFYVWYFDPERNSSRKVEFEGVVDAEFWVRYDGKIKRKVNGLYALTNHIESLVSM